MEETAAQMPSLTEEKVFEFRAGIFGFPEAKRFVIVDIPGGGEIFKQLVSVDQPGVGFTLVFPSAFFPDFMPEIPDEEIRELGVESPEQAVVMVIARVPENFRETTANLKAPVVFNPYTRRGRQVILQDERYTTRHCLFKV